MKFSPFNFFKMDPGAAKLEARMDKERNLTKVTTPDHNAGNHKIRYEPKPEFTNEILQLRDSVADMDIKLQAITSERDSLKAEFNNYREATQADQRDLEKENQRLRSDLLTTGQELSLRIAAQGQLGPLPDMTEDSTPEGRTDRHYMRLARQLKSGSTGEPTTQRIERP
jgi:molecular chaperone GrpE (heat shock protein)